jgi:hypothetical protein
VVFVGTTSSTTVNGEVVQHDELNVAGLVLAIAGLVLAFRVVRGPGRNRIVRSVIAGAGSILCLVQLPISVGLLFDDEPAASSDDGDGGGGRGGGGGGLSDTDARIARNQIANNDRATAYGVIRLGFVGIVTDTRVHMTYADDCHGGDYRLEMADVPEYPDFIRSEDVTSIESNFDVTYPQGFEVACDEANTRHYMSELVDDIEHARAMLEIEVDTYREVHGDAPP